MKPGDSCRYCPQGTIHKKSKRFKEVLYVVHSCDVCGAQFCLECEGTINVMAEGAVKHRGMCSCEEHQDRIKNYLQAK
jgi:hypothetical protein